MSDQGIDMVEIGIQPPIPQKLPPKNTLHRKMMYAVALCGFALLEACGSSSATPLPLHLNASQIVQEESVSTPAMDCVKKYYPDSVVHKLQQTGELSFQTNGGHQFEIINFSPYSILKPGVEEYANWMETIVTEGSDQDRTLKYHNMINGSFVDQEVVMKPRSPQGESLVCILPYDTKLPQKAGGSPYAFTIPNSDPTSKYSSITFVRVFENVPPEFNPPYTTPAEFLTAQLTTEIGQTITQVEKKTNNNPIPPEIFQEAIVNAQADRVTASIYKYPDSKTKPFDRRQMHVVRANTAYSFSGLPLPSAILGKHAYPQLMLVSKNNSAQ